MVEICFTITCTQPLYDHCSEAKSYVIFSDLMHCNVQSDCCYYQALHQKPIAYHLKLRDVSQTTTGHAN